MVGNESEESVGQEETLPDIEKLKFLLHQMEHHVSLDDVKNGVLSVLCRLGLNHIVLCDGGIVMSKKTVEVLTHNGVPSLMLDGGMFWLNVEVEEGRGKQILDEFFQLNHVVLVMNKEVAQLHGYAELMPIIPHLRVIESRYEAIRFITENQSSR